MTEATVGMVTLALGGDEAIAKRLGITASAVRMWKFKRCLPARLRHELDEFAREQGMQIPASLFSNGKPGPRRKDAAE